MRIAEYRGLMIKFIYTLYIFTKYKKELRGFSVPKKNIIDDPKERMYYLENLVSKQLDLYGWCEEKVSTLATIDSILIGAAIIFAEKVISIDTNTNCYEKIINVIIITLVLLPLFVSLCIALWHIRPKMGKASNTGTPNHRSSNGIRHFENSKIYKKTILSLTDDRICDDLTKQIYGMNNNIWKNQQSIKIAVFFDLIGVIGFLIMIVYYAIK